MFLIETTLSCLVPHSEKIAQGRVHQKRDIVDTKTHASCAAGQNRDKQSPFPTM